MRPNDKDAKLKYQECHKIVKQKAFERAIASDEHKRSVVDSLDIESMSEPPRSTPFSSLSPSKNQGTPFSARWKEEWTTRVPSKGSEALLGVPWGAWRLL